MLTVGSTAKVGTSDTRDTVEGILVRGTLGDQSIKVINSGTIYTDDRGIDINAKTSRGDVSSNIEVEHAGTIDVTDIGIHVLYSRNRDKNKGTRTDDIIITTMEDSMIKSGSDDGITAYHNGKEGDIRVTHDNSIVAGMDGIQAFHYGKEGSDNVITINGSIDAGRVGIFTTSNVGGGSGGITITTEENSNINSKGTDDGEASINASVRDMINRTAVGGSGSVTVTHKGTITSKAEGIYVSYQKAGTSGNTGNLTVTTEEGSMITADRHGIEAYILDSNASGDITITHRGKITAKMKGLILTNTRTGDITVATGESSMITADDDDASTNADDGIYAYSEAGNTGDITATHDGTITGENAGINLLHEETGKIMVTTEKDSMITAEITEGIYAEGKTGASGDMEVTHNGTIKLEGSEIILKGTYPLTTSTSQSCLKANCRQANHPMQSLLAIFSSHAKLTTWTITFP